jgi:hypothetical protein
LRRSDQFRDSRPEAVAKTSRERVRVPTLNPTTLRFVDSGTPMRLKPTKPSFRQDSVSTRQTDSVREAEEEVAYWKAMVASLPRPDPSKSPMLISTLGLDTEEVEKLREEQRIWAQVTALREQYGNAYRKALKQLHSMETVPMFKERKLKKDLPILKFTPQLAITMPFYIWYREFSRELARLRADELYMLDMLYYWVDRKCFQPWSASMTEEDMNDFETVISCLDKQYPDRSTSAERREEFRKYIQKAKDVLEYSNEKERLFRLAYPESDPFRSSEFRDSWLMGLYKPIQKDIRTYFRDIDTTNVSSLTSEAVRLSRIHEQCYGDKVKKTTEKPPVKEKSGRKKEKSSTNRKDEWKSTSNSRGAERKTTEKRNSDPRPDSSYCYHFWRDGNCPRGADCPYPHISNKKFRVKETTSTVLAASSDTPKSTLRKGGKTDLGDLKA